MGLVYLAGSIDLVSDNDRNDWRDEVTKLLADKEHSVFNPAKAFNVSLADHDVSRKLIAINENAMFSSDYVIIVLSKDKPSIGTPIELFMLARSNNKNNTPHYVVVWNPHPNELISSTSKTTMSKSFKRDKIDPNLPAYIGGITKNVVSSFSDAIAFIEFVENGGTPSEFFSDKFKHFSITKKTT